MDIVNNFDWSQFLTLAVRLLAAFGLALPIAWDRERSTRIMGLRTFPLVAVASCGFILLVVETIDFDAAAQARVIQGLMTGIGFVGGGAILKNKNEVQGTATAVSIWITGALGTAVGYGRYELAVLIGLITFLTLRFLTPIEERMSVEDSENNSSSE